MRDFLDNTLNRDFGIAFDSIRKTFIVVNDGAAIIAEIDGRSVSSRISVLDEKWIHCYLNVLCNSIKFAIRKSSKDFVLVHVWNDFKAMNSLVEYSKRIR